MEAVIVLGIFAAIALFVHFDSQKRLDLGDFFAVLGIILLIGISAYAYFAYATKRNAEAVLVSQTEEAYSAAASQITESFKKAKSVVCFRENSSELMKDFQVVVVDREVRIVGPHSWYTSDRCYGVVGEEEGSFHALLESGAVIAAKKKLLLRQLSFSRCARDFIAWGSEAAVFCCFDDDPPSEEEVQQNGVELLKECFLSEEEKVGALLDDGSVVLAESVLP